MSNWYALYCKSRTEKKAAERLEKNGWEVYCPLKVEVRQWSDRKKKVEVPYFPSYIFARLENYEKQASSILYDPSLVSFVFWQGRPAIISDKEMAEIKEFLEKFKGQKIVSESYKVGTKVTLGKGPFEGKEGVVKEVRKNKIVLVIEAIACQLVVDI